MPLKGTNQEFGRPYNRRIVLETIRLHGPIARGEIAGRVGLTVQTVSNIIRELDELSFIAGSRTASKRRGYPATSLSINPDGGYALGIHITPLGLEAGLINLAGEIVARDKRPVPYKDPVAAFAHMEKVITRLRNEKPGKRMLGVGLAMPGPFNVESMSFVGPTTLEGWKGFPVERRLAEISKLPAFIEVDHAAAALGERLYGAGQAYRDFYYLYFGVGLGGCMVHDGLPLRGVHRNAGEIGHIPVVPDGEACACGNRGCLERYLSLEAFERRTRSVGEAGWIVEAAPKLRSAVTTVENLFDPETVIIGGLVPQNLMNSLLTAATPLMNSISERKGRAVPRITLSNGGPDSVLRGAAALAVDGVLSPRFGIMFAREDVQDLRDPMMKRVEAA